MAIRVHGLPLLLLWVETPSGQRGAGRVAGRVVVLGEGDAVVGGLLQEARGIWRVTLCQSRER
jgi:hypothetical protein